MLANAVSWLVTAVLVGLGWLISSHYSADPRYVPHDTAGIFREIAMFVIGTILALIGRSEKRSIQRFCIIQGLIVLLVAYLCVQTHYSLDDLVRMPGNASLWWALRICVGLYVSSLGLSLAMSLLFKRKSERVAQALKGSGI